MISASVRISSKLSLVSSYLLLLKLSDSLFAGKFIEFAIATTLSSEPVSNFL